VPLPLNLWPSISLGLCTSCSSPDPTEGQIPVITPLRARSQARIEGGSRRKIGLATPITLDACSSRDPDDPDARCSSVSSCGVLLFQWRCVSSGPGCVPPMDSTRCTWTIPAGVLLAGRTYAIGLTVRKVGPNVVPEAANASVVLEVAAGQLPTVTISSLPLPKQPATERLALVATGSMPGVLSAELAYSWSIQSVQSDESAVVDLNSLLVSSTRQASRNLVILPSVLRSGAQYTFTVTASYAGLQGTAAIVVVSCPADWRIVHSSHPGALATLMPRALRRHYLAHV
jgi:hypothetical protein